MATLTQEQINNLKTRGLSDERIRELAAARGLTMPSAGVTKKEGGDLFGQVGKVFGRTIGRVMNPFGPGVSIGENVGEKAGKLVGGALGTVSRVTGVEKLGQGLGYSLFQLTPEYKELNRLLENGSLSPQEFTRLSTGDITNKEVIGSGIRTVASTAAAGVPARGGTFTLRGGPVVNAAPTAANVAGNIGRGVRVGAATGAGLGTVAGVAEGISENRGVLGTLQNAAGGAFAGGLGGAVLGAGVGAVSGGGIGQGIARGARAGAVQGGTFGAVSGAATAVEQDQDLPDAAAEVAAQGIRGASLGAGVGGVVGGLAGGVQTAVRNVAERKRQAFEILSNQMNVLPDESVARPVSRAAAPYKVDPVLQTVVKDSTFKDAVKNTALLPDDLALVKSSQRGDFDAYEDMIRIAQSDDIASVEPINSRVGKTFLNRVKDIVKVQERAGKEIDQIARERLTNSTIDDLTAQVDELSEALGRRGVSVDEAGALDFADSDFEDLPGVQRLLNTVWKRAQKLDNNGLKAHQLKRFIDEQLNYGKSAEGVGGASERIVKAFRAGIDGALDQSDEAYNIANTKYAKAISARERVQKLLGSDFSIDSELAEARAGEVMQRVLGSAPSRALQTLADVEKTAVELGNKYNDSVIAQIRFADMLEDVVGAPNRSLAGQVQRATNRVAQIPEFIRQTVPFMDSANDTLQRAFTRTPEERLASLFDYIQKLK